MNSLNYRTQYNSQKIQNNILSQIEMIWKRVEELEKLSIKGLGDENPISETLGIAAVNIMNSFFDIREQSGLSLNISAHMPVRKFREANTAIAYGRFTLTIENGIYEITSPQGESKTFRLPSIDDKRSIQALTHEVESFVREQGGSIGQIKSARKKLTEFGYHITK